MQTQTAPAPSVHSNGAVTVHRQRTIKKVAVLGAGIMGSRIAMHFANIGVPALLLDMVPNELTPEEQAAGQTLEKPAVRNRIVNSLFQAAVKASPSPIYDKSYLSRVTLGNFTDDLKRVADCDWIIEVVVENLEIKQKLYAQLEQYRKPGTLITSNTSGIPIHHLSQGRSEDFRKHFCGTHFFNPPRYLALLEIIPTPDTDPAITDFLMHYGDLYLGKKTVHCKDTPAFIANRIGMFSFMDLFYKVEKHNLLVEEVDKLTGPLIGHAKSATFRTSDVVGLDTSVKVAAGIYANCPDDEQRDLFKLPAFVQSMVDKKMFGDKTGGGFFKKVKAADGSSEILGLNLKTLEYQPQIKVKSPSLDALKNIEDVPGRIRSLAAATDKYGDFVRDIFYGLFAYVSHRVPEIADDLYPIDQAVAAGYGWQYGPFETWDILGVEATAKAMKAAGVAYAPWVDDMLTTGAKSFYRVEKGLRQYYEVASKTYKNLPGGADFIILDDLRAGSVVWSNSGTSLFDLGDGILNLEFRTKMNTLGGEVLEGVNYAIDLAEKSYRGLVIGNQGENFSAGANLAMMFMLAANQDFDELEMAVRTFQNTVMRIRYSGIPVIVGSHALTLGGGCEMSMHADRAQVAAETYMGLVEAGVGLIPGGCGTKEMAVRISDAFHEGDAEVNTFTKYFMNPAQAKVSTSAAEAFDLGYLTVKDRISINKDRQLADAKRSAIELADAGYTQPLPKKVRVLGKEGLGMVLVATSGLEFAGYASAHDRLIAEKIGYVICGGDLSQPSYVSEQYLIDLEREAFLSLVTTQKSMERIQHMLQTGKPLRN